MPATHYSAHTFQAMAAEFTEPASYVYTFPEELPDSSLSGEARRSRLFVLAKRRFEGKTLTTNQIDAAFINFGKKCLRGASVDDRVWHLDVENDIRKILRGFAAKVEKR